MWPTFVDKLDSPWGLDIVVGVVGAEEAGQRNCPIQLADDSSLGLASR